MLSHLRAATQSLVDWKFLCKQITNRVLSLVLFFVCRFAQQQIPITSISELRSFYIISFVPCVSLSMSVTGYIWAFFSCTPASSLLLLSYVIRLRWTKSIQVRKPTKTTKTKKELPRITSQIQKHRKILPKPIRTQCFCFSRRRWWQQRRRRRQWEMTRKQH